MADASKLREEPQQDREEEREERERSEARKLEDLEPDEGQQEHVKGGKVAMQDIT